MVFLPARLEVAGVAAAVDQALITNVKNFVIPVALNTVNNLDFGQIDFDGGWVRDVKCDLKVNDLNTIKVVLNPSDNGITFDVSDVQGQITGQFKYKLLLISATGKFRVTFKTGAVKLHMDMPLHTRLYNGRMLPSVMVQNFYVSIDSSKIKIDLYGSFLSDIADQFIWIFKSIIIHEIQDSINSMAPDLINISLNNLIVSTNGFATLYNDITLDFQFPEDPVVTSNQIGLFLNATIFSKKIGYKVPLSAPLTDLATQLTTTNTILADVSQYSADSLLLLVHDMGLFVRTISQSSLPAKYQYMLTTSYLGTYIPGLVNTYGENQPVTVNVKTINAPLAFFKANEMGAYITAEIEMIVNGEQALLFDIVDADAFITATLNDFIFQIKVDSIHIKDIVILNSAIGDIAIKPFLRKLNLLFIVGVPIINLFIGNGFKLPNSFFGFLVLESATLQSYAGYLQITTQPTFV